PQSGSWSRRPSSCARRSRSWSAEPSPATWRASSSRSVSWTSGRPSRRVLFNSEAYLFFLPAVVVLTWCLPSRLRPAFLLLASWYFYAFWSPPFLFLIIGLTIANYLVGLVQGRQAERRRSLLVLALLID